MEKLEVCQNHNEGKNLAQKLFFGVTVIAIFLTTLSFLVVAQTQKNIWSIDMERRSE